MPSPKFKAPHLISNIPNILKFSTVRVFSIRGVGGPNTMVKLKKIEYGTALYHNNTPLCPIFYLLKGV